VICVKTTPQGDIARSSIAREGERVDLDDVFAALSDPIRRAIVAELAHGARSVSELGAPFAVSAPAISRHLNVLERVGLIVRWKEGRVRYCRLVADPLVQAGIWIDQHKVFWERRLDSLADYLEKEEEICNPPSLEPPG
jgi:DNA-binding transcriptional ArsR family regulator